MLEDHRFDPGPCIDTDWKSQFLFLVLWLSIAPSSSFLQRNENENKRSTFQYFKTLKKKLNNTESKIQLFTSGNLWKRISSAVGRAIGSFWSKSRTNERKSGEYVSLTGANVPWINKIQKILLKIILETLINNSYRYLK